MVAFQVIGKPAPKVEGADKVRGAAKYGADFSLPGMIWGKILRSPHAHARIISIDTTEARALPGVHAVITGKDTGPGLWGGIGMRDYPVLAQDKVRFIGEGVAAVAADDEDTAQQALNLIEVEYEELPAVYTIEDAQAADAPIIHPDFNSYSGVFFEHRDGPDMYSSYSTGGIPGLKEPANKYHTWEINIGDVDKGFAEADKIVENSFVTQRMHQAYLEPRNALVNINEEGRVEIWGSIKSPYGSRSVLSLVADIPETDIVVNHAYLGGDFGGKGTPIVVPICYFLAKACGRPVMMVYEYLEELLAGNGRHEVQLRVKTGVKNDGTLTSHQVWYQANSGAYACFKPWGLIWGPTQALGVYRVPNCRVEQTHTYTNTVPAGFMRMPGEVQAFFALESHIDEVARSVGMDPVDFRMKNLIDDGEPMPMGLLYDDLQAKETLAAAIEASGYRSEKAPNVGRGVAICHKASGGGNGRVEVTLKPDGSVTVGTGIFDQGTGTYSVMCQVVAEELQVPLSRISIDTWDTDAESRDAAIAASRGARLGSSLGYAAADETKKALFALAASHLGCSSDELSLRGDEIWRRDIEESIAWPKLIEMSGEDLVGIGHYNDPDRSHYTSFSVQFAEVEVDPDTGEVTVRRFTNAFDVGGVLDPIAHQGQINGNIIQGMGYAMSEELLVEDGRVTNLSMGDYKIPAIADVPPLTSVLVRGPGGLGPYKVKGVGEQLSGAVAPAIANAIADAVGVRIRELPITSEKVYKALQERKG